MTTTEATAPFHLVSHLSGKHIGPFSSYTDALLARQIAGLEFREAKILDRVAFDAHLKNSAYQARNEISDRWEPR